MTDNVVPVEEMNRRRRVNMCADEILRSWRLIGDLVKELHDLGVPTQEWADLIVRQLSTETQKAIGQHPAEALAATVDLMQKVFGPDALEPTSAFPDIMKMLSGTTGGGFSVGKLLPFVMNMVGQFMPSTPQPEYGDDELLVDKEAYLSARASRVRALIERLFASAPSLGNGQAPAVEVAVVLRTGVQLQGSLSVAPEGLLRMLSPNQKTDPRTRQPIGTVMVESFFDYEEVASVAVIREVELETKPSIITPG